jgi:2,3-bisphosphoglycerate-independent phosphoglycerate mutase
MLIILDGWGIREASRNNAVAMATTPCLDHLSATYPHTRLVCSGSAVGLPDGVMGNSEVGHMNIGAGRIVYQDLLRINRAIDDGTFFENATFERLLASVRQHDGDLHLMGLLSDGGVHSHINHLKALIDLARNKGFERLFVHAILDGRDTPPDSGIGFLRQLQQHLDDSGTGTVASICGRYYAMDRDTRWERVEQAYRLFVEGRGRAARDPVAAVQAAYERGETDEFVKPLVMVNEAGHPRATVQAGDGIIFFNFRADRAREITRAFVERDFEPFQRPQRLDLSGFVCMTRYDDHFDLPVAFKPQHLTEILGEVLSRRGLRQLRIAETEKYAHVTYFFNGGEERPFAGEERCLIPSPREVATYDEKPEMSAPQVTDEVLARLAKERYHFVVLNFANMDMVGHTGVLSAAIEACQTVDRCLARIVPEVLTRNGTVMVTADHGNSETMANGNGGPHTAHTLNPVPFILVDDARRNLHLREGILADIAPTVLDCLAIEAPPAMTGRSLIAASQ